MRLLIQGLTKVPSGCCGQVDFEVRHGTGFEMMGGWSHTLVIGDSGCSSSTVTITHRIEYSVLLAEHPLTVH